MGSQKTATAPATDELEVTVFGRGFGEAIVAHIGNNEWVLVDSCIDPESGRPASVGYLESMGVSPAEAVRLVVITHWDDDHVAGVADTVRACASANVSCSAALGRRDIVEFVVGQEAAADALGSGLDELRTVLRLCASRRLQIIWAKANLPLHPHPPGSRAVVVALSPSENSVQRSVESLIEAATQKDIAVQGRYRAPDGPNAASVATSVFGDDSATLLGADLEATSNLESGWAAVLGHSKPDSRASLVKVPHHGSDGAHHDQMWTEIVAPDVVAIVTPWAKGRAFLPRQRDLDRLRRLTSRVYLSAMPVLRERQMDSERRTLIRRLHGSRIEELRGWGFVRARRRPGEAAWRVELAGDAVAVN